MNLVHVNAQIYERALLIAVIMLHLFMIKIPILQWNVTMTTTEEEDDRWSNFRDHGMKHHLGTKVSTDPEPELADYLRVVLAKKSPRDRQERKYLVSFHHAW